MHSFYISVQSVQQVQEFIDLACTFPFDITISDGSHSFNGKSLMSFFCMDHSNPMQVMAHCSDEEFDGFYHTVRRFCAP